LAVPVARVVAFLAVPVVFLAPVFFAVAFLAPVFFAVPVAFLVAFLAVPVALVVAFLAPFFAVLVAFLAGERLAVVFFAGAFFAVDFLAVVFFAGLFFADAVAVDFLVGDFFVAAFAAGLVAVLVALRTPVVFLAAALFVAGTFASLVGNQSGPCAGTTLVMQG
jgi:hypothetical protein